MTRVIRLVCEEIMVARPISNTHIPHIKNHNEHCRQKQEK